MRGFSLLDNKMKNQKNSNVIETTGNIATSKADADLEKPRNYRMKVNPLKISPSTIIIKPQLKEVVEKEALSSQTNGIERSQSLHHDNSTVAATKEVDDNARDSGEAAGKVIPVVEENFDLTKKTVLHFMKILKRRATKTEKIEVPIMYEEVYVGDKKLQLYDKEEEGILSKIKDTITHGISAPEENDIEYRYPVASSSSSQSSKSRSLTDPRDEYNNPPTGGGELVALIEGQQDNNKETERTVPIWGEEIIISKRKIKLGEVVIRKRRIVENRKIDVDIKKEKVSVEYPNGSHKELTPSPSSS
jgi:stress response protein YsnF